MHSKQNRKRTEHNRKDISIRRQKKGNQGLSPLRYRHKLPKSLRCMCAFRISICYFPFAIPPCFTFFQTCWKLSFHWIPGHKGHSGNTMADTLASTGSAGHGHPFHLPSSLHTLKAKINRSVKSFWEHHHESHSCKASGFTRDLFSSLSAYFYLHKKLPTLMTFICTQSCQHSLVLKHCAGHFSTNYFLFSVQQPPSPYCSHCTSFHWYRRAPHSALPKIRSHFLFCIYKILEIVST